MLVTWHFTIIEIDYLSLRQKTETYERSYPSPNVVLAIGDRVVE